MRREPNHSNCVYSLDGLLGGAFLMLTLVAPYQTSKSRQQMQVWLWSIVVFVMFSVLISLFRVKNRGKLYFYIIQRI